MRNGGSMGLIHLPYVVYEATGRGHLSSIDDCEDGNIEQQAQLKSYQWVIQY